MFKKKLFSHYVEQQLRTSEINPDERGPVSNASMALVELAEAIDALELEQGMYLLGGVNFRERAAPQNRGEPRAVQEARALEVIRVIKCLADIIVQPAQHPVLSRCLTFRIIILGLCCGSTLVFLPIPQQRCWIACTLRHFLIPLARRKQR